MSKMSRTDNNTFVLIDLSSFIFHRYFAIKSWIKIAKIELPTDETDKKAFILLKFKQGFLKHMLNIQKKTKAPWDHIFLIKDCPRDTIWRRNKSAEYKLNREERAVEFDIAVFPISYDEIIPSLHSQYNFRMFEYKNAEADDIIAIFKNKIRRELSGSKIFIISNDNDFIQLNDSSTFILSNVMKPLKDKFTEEMLSVFLKWKIIKGDISDNIPPIETKIGDKVALQLALHPDKLELLLSKNAATLKQYKLNTILIDFECIPTSIKNGVEELLKVI